MQAVQPVMPPWLFKLLSTAIRLVNNVVGGMSFVRIPSPGPVTAPLALSVRVLGSACRIVRADTCVGQVTLAKMLKVQESSASPASRSEL